MAAVGMIGLGNAGLPMAQNLIAAGYQVVGRRRGDPKDLIASGGVAAASAREVAERCEIILSCLPHGEALADVVTGPQGLASGPCDGRILVELSTLDTTVKRTQADAFAARGGRMLDCAISGIPKMIRERQGVFFISGDQATYEAVKPVLDAVSTKVFYMGAFGNALKTKLCANMLVSLNIAASAETLAFGAKMGLDPLRLIEAVKDGAGASLQFSARAQLMATGDWETVRGSTAMLAKDVHLIEKRGREVQCPTPLLDAAARIYDDAINAGYGETDVASVFAVVAKGAGLPIPKKS